MKIQPDTIIQALNWRYATQIFDQTKPLEPELLKVILESGRLSPSPYGVEPWKFIVVENPDTRAKLRAVGYNQPKITDAPYLVVIAYRTDLKENISQERIERTAKIHGQDHSIFAGLKDMIDMTVNNKSETDLEIWSKYQAYIPLGMMVETAALLGVDSGPMEGFDAIAVDEVLGLKAKNLRSTSMIALGYRGEDPAAKRPKVRRDFDEVVEFIK
ncbi:MAG TPA: NAD(P)H-dependent oxidoreductase [Patescibacteria group bacterium]